MFKLLQMFIKSIVEGDGDGEGDDERCIGDA